MCVHAPQDLPPLPLGPGGAQHGAELWVGDTRYEYVDQAVRKALDGQAKAKAQAETKGSTKSFRIGGKCGAGTDPRYDSQSSMPRWGHPHRRPTSPAGSACLGYGQ